MRPSVSRIQVNEWGERRDAGVDVDSMPIFRAKCFPEVKEAKLNYIYELYIFLFHFITLIVILLVFSFKLSDLHVRFHSSILLWDNKSMILCILEKGLWLSFHIYLSCWLGNLSIGSIDWLPYSDISLKETASERQNIDSGTPYVIISTMMNDDPWSYNYLLHVFRLIALQTTIKNIFSP